MKAKDAAGSYGWKNADLNSLLAGKAGGVGVICTEAPVGLFGLRLQY